MMTQKQYELPELSPEGWQFELTIRTPDHDYVTTACPSTVTCEYPLFPVKEAWLNCKEIYQQEHNLEKGCWFIGTLPDFKATPPVDPNTVFPREGDLSVKLLYQPPSNLEPTQNDEEKPVEPLTVYELPLEPFALNPASVRKLYGRAGKRRATYAGTNRAPLNGCYHADNERSGHSTDRVAIQITDSVIKNFRVFVPLAPVLSFVSDFFSHVRRKVLFAPLKEIQVVEYDERRPPVELINPPEDEESEEVPNYSAWRVVELRSECERLNLNAKGSKSELKNRLDAYHEVKTTTKTTTTTNTNTTTTTTTATASEPTGEPTQSTENTPSKREEKVLQDTDVEGGKEERDVGEGETSHALSPGSVSPSRLEPDVAKIPSLTESKLRKSSFRNAFQTQDIKIVPYLYDEDKNKPYAEVVMANTMLNSRKTMLMVGGKLVNVEELNAKAQKAECKRRGVKILGLNPQLLLQKLRLFALREQLAREQEEGKAVETKEAPKEVGTEKAGEFVNGVPIELLIGYGKEIQKEEVCEDTEEDVQQQPQTQQLQEDPKQKNNRAMTRSPSVTDMKQMFAEPNTAVSTEESKDKENKENNSTTNTKKRKLDTEETGEEAKAARKKQKLATIDAGFTTLPPTPPRASQRKVNRNTSLAFTITERKEEKVESVAEVKKEGESSVEKKGPTRKGKRKRIEGDEEKEEDMKLKSKKQKTSTPANDEVITEPDRRANDSGSEDTELTTTQSSPTSQTSLKHFLRKTRARANTETHEKKEVETMSKSLEDMECVINAKFKSAKRKKDKTDAEALLVMMRELKDMREKIDFVYARHFERGAYDKY